MSPAALPFRDAFRALPLLGRINLALLAAAILGLTLWLWPEWRENPDLSHGFFMPLVFLLLLHESRRGTPRYLPATPGTRLAFALLLGAGLSALTLAGLYAAAVDWSHALVDVMLTCSLAATLGAGLLVYSSARHRLIPFNWTSIVAVALWVFTSPLPPGTYARLTLQLQLLVSEGTLRMLHLLGIAAIRHGNVIDLANTSVGVEEACSGVRSLISCVFAGLFFSATLVRRPWARALLIALSAPLALAMNFLRSLTLTLLANRQIDISGTWHDVTGFAVLGITAAILGGLALALERKPTPASAVEPPRVPAAATFGAGRDRILAAGLGLALALVALFVANTRPAPRVDGPMPDLFALLPATADGWQVKSSDLYEFRGTLKTEHLAQRHYVRADGSPVEIIIYVAFWPAGQAPVSLVASHTPDACWPGSGWESLPVRDPRMNLTAGPRSLPDAEHRLFQAGSRPQHVWFWHLYNGRPIAFQDPYSPRALLALALRYGFRRAGDQLFVRISSNRPWSEIAHEPPLAQFFAHTQPLGL